MEEGANNSAANNPAATPADLMAEVSRIANQSGSLPPVHLWNPPLCDNVQMRIDRSGRWYYQNSPIGRERMVRLFSTVLRLDEDGCHYLVTPGEKILVQVEQCPFVVVGWQAAGQKAERVISLCTNVGEEFLLDAEHPLRLQTSDKGEPIPCVDVRSGLEALIGRSVFYQMVELALAEGDTGEDGLRGLFSCGQFFPLEQVEAHDFQTDNDSRELLGYD